MSLEGRLIIGLSWMKEMLNWGIVLLGKSAKRKMMRRMDHQERIRGDGTDKGGR